MDTGDSIESTPALDVEDGSVVALYTANAIVNGGKNGVCTMRFFTPEEFSHLTLGERGVAVPHEDYYRQILDAIVKKTESL